MLRPLIIILITMVVFTTSNLVLADKLLASSSSAVPIGEYIQIFQEGGDRLNLSEAQQRFDGDETLAFDNKIIGFGLGSNPSWLKLEVINQEKKSVERRLLIETSWLDSIEIYVVYKDDVVEQLTMGDNKNFSERTVLTRFFSFDHHYPAGITRVYIRVETPDPMSLPLYFLSLKDAGDRYLSQAYSYGLLYGAAFSLLLYNLMLYVGLRTRRHLYFSIYLFSFLAMNFSYTGHGFQWLWPQSPLWQQWSNPVSMMAFNLSGLVFALVFLNIRKNMPHLYRIVVGFCGIFSILQLLVILSSSHYLSISLAFFFMLMFSTIMVFLGVVSLKFENTSARYFLLASIFGAVGSTLTACSVLGWIPYNQFTYHAVDIGILLDMVLLAFALAEQFRITEKEKISAEILARSDPLTKLYNRRAFYEKVEPMWVLSNRNNGSRAIIIFDIDYFKAINDNYGHAAGDSVLEALGQQVDYQTRACDVAARWGGEEFIVFLYDAGLEDAVLVAKKLQRAMEDIVVDTEEGKISFTASFGVSVYEGSNHSLAELITEADKKLYRAKSRGRNQVCC